jgi:hypothetical protein
MIHAHNLRGAGASSSSRARRRIITPLL